MPLVADKIICDPYFPSVTEKNTVGVAPYERFHILFCFLNNPSQSLMNNYCVELEKSKWLCVWLPQTVMWQSVWLEGYIQRVSLMGKSESTVQIQRFYR